MFGTERNARLAKRAMAQETWLGKLSVAFQLYGRADATDAVLAEFLRAM
jgi:hypothetical protein